MIASRSVDLEALAALRADLSEQADTLSELTDEEAVNGIEPSTVVINSGVVEALKDNVDEGIKQLDMLFSSAASEFVE